MSVRSYQLNISDYGKTIKMIFVLMIIIIIPIVLIGVLASKKIIVLSPDQFKFFLISFLAVVVLLTIYMIKKLNKQVTIELDSGSLVIVNYVTINYSDISKLKRYHHKGYESVILKTKKGVHLFIGPKGNWKEKDLTKFEEFKSSLFSAYEKVR